MAKEPARATRRLRVRGRAHALSTASRWWRANRRWRIRRTPRACPHRPPFIGRRSLSACSSRWGCRSGQSRIAVAERDRAAPRFEDAREMTNALIFRIHDEVRPLPGSTPVRHGGGGGAEVSGTSERGAGDDAALRIRAGQGYSGSATCWAGRRGQPRRPRRRGRQPPQGRRAVAAARVQTRRGAGRGNRAREGADCPVRGTRAPPTSVTKALAAAQDAIGNLRSPGRACAERRRSAPACFGSTFSRYGGRG